MYDETTKGLQMTAMKTKTFRIRADQISALKKLATAETKSTKRNVTSNELVRRGIDLVIEHAKGK